MKHLIVLVKPTKYFLFRWFTKFKAPSSSGISTAVTVFEYQFFKNKSNPYSFTTFLVASPIFLCLSITFSFPYSRILSIATLREIISLIGIVYGNHLSL